MKKISVVKNATVIACAGLLSLMVLQSNRPEEGMFPLNYVNMNDLKNSGMKLSKEEIFNPGNVSLTNALVKVGGCTGSFISDEGLIITNHHCVYGSVAELSTVEQNHLENGFVAKTKSEELRINMPCKITMSYEDVSKRVLEGVTSDLTPANRLAKIAANIEAIRKVEIAKNPGLSIEISEMFVGRTFVLFRYMTLQDVRLVLAPPVTIGQFGGDSDNWEWPRHNGDFSLVRAYVGKDGKPAPYNKDNIPFKPEAKLKINPNGTQEGDFVFIMGYPGRTFRNESAAYMKFQEDIHLKKIQQWFAFVINSMKESTAKFPDQRLARAGDIQSLENTEKNYRGKIQGLRRTGLVAAKYKEEAEMLNWFQSNNKYSETSGSNNKNAVTTEGQINPISSNAVLAENTLKEIEQIWDEKRKMAEIRYWLTASQQSSLTQLAATVEATKLALLFQYQQIKSKSSDKTIAASKGHVYAELMVKYIKNLQSIINNGAPFNMDYEHRLLHALVTDFAPKDPNAQYIDAKKQKHNVPIPLPLMQNTKQPVYNELWANNVVKATNYQLNDGKENTSVTIKAMMDKSEKILNEIKGMNYESAYKVLVKSLFAKDDALSTWGRLINYWNNQINPLWSEKDDAMKALMPKYLALKSDFKASMFIPDANSTLRLTYGHIRRYSPNDGEIHLPYTYLDGIFEKANTRPDYRLPKVVADNLRVSNVNPMLRDPKTGKVIVALLYNLDTTGGNSGSPVMNDKGELIGINFDRSFTATINDYAWNENYSRSIGCDIRYVLYVMKYISKADHLLQEIGISL